MDRMDLGKWWLSLSDGTRRRLRERPYDPVPATSVDEVVGAALQITGIYWPDTYPPRAAQFRLPTQVSNWIFDLDAQMPPSENRP